MKSVLFLVLLSGSVAMHSTAQQLSKLLKEKDPADSLLYKEYAKYDSFTKEITLSKREALYAEYLKNYPTGPDVDNMRIDLITDYLQAKRFTDYECIAPLIKDTIALAYALDKISMTMAKKDENLNEASKLSKLSFDIINATLKDSATCALMGGKEYADSYYRPKLDAYGNTHAYILAKQGKFTEAYAYEQQIYKDTEGDDAGINETYATILAGIGKNKDAMLTIEKAMKKGKSTPSMVTTLKTAYIKLNRSEKGFDAYYKPLSSSYYRKKKADYLEQMINTPAVKFALKDFNGNIVSLTGLKGKVVVLDFWATWCGPCIASFPAMKKAVTKYKNNAGVKFLFIDVGNITPEYLAESKKFIADHKYPFQVLEDESSNLKKGFGTIICANYGIDDIPAKLVLDRNGHIRFKETGFDGDDEKLIHDIAVMIELAGHAN